MKAQFKVVVTALSVLIIIALPNISSANNDDDIRKRVQKVGQLNIQAESSAQTMPETQVMPTEMPMAETKTSPEPASETMQASTLTEPSEETASDSTAVSAEEPYQASCFACHGTGAAGAPILGDAAAWAPRIAKGDQNLIDNAINGIGAMPPRGGSSLDDQAITAVVNYMIEQSR